MLNNFKINYQLSFSEKLLFPLYSIYADRHWNKTLLETTWKGYLIHLGIGLIEAIPLIGAIASLFEKTIMDSFIPSHSSDLNINELPNEIFFRIFAFTQGKDYPISQVCKKWNETQDAFYQHTFESIVQFLDQKEKHTIYQNYHLDFNNPDFKAGLQVLFQYQHNTLNSDELNIQLINKTNREHYQQKLIPLVDPSSPKRFKNAESFITTQKLIREILSVKPNNQVEALYQFGLKIGNFQSILHDRPAIRKLIPLLPQPPQWPRWTVKILQTCRIVGLISCVGIPIFRYPLVKI